MSKLVNCKACEHQIAKGVKKCPSCGKDQRNFFLRHKIMTFFGGLLALIVIFSAAPGGEEETTVATEATSDAEASDTDETVEEVVYNVGDTIPLERVEVSVTKVEEREEVGDEYSSKVASDGGTFVAVQWTIKNTSEEPIGSFSTPTVGLIDENDTSYDTDLDASVEYAMETEIDNSKVLSDLNPGISVTSADAFEVSKEQFSQGEWFIEIDGEKVSIK